MTPSTPTRIYTVPRPLLWLNILSLDAPLVAVVWQDFFARCLGLRLDAAPRVVLALAIWLAYAADRWLDGWKIPCGAAITARHRFAQDYRAPLAVVWVMVLCATVNFAWFSLPLYLFERGAVLTLGVAIYFFLNQWPKTTLSLRGLKEIMVGILFVSGTVIFLTPSARVSPLELGWACAAWCLLVFLNCYAIACWESKADRVGKQESIVTRWPFLANRLNGMAWLVATIALLPIAFRFSLFTLRLGLVVAASSLSLAMLDYWGNSLDGDLLRTAADLVLLTPLLFRFL